MGNRIKPEEKAAEGFTLVELVVVILLIGLMFSFALPKMDGLLFSDGSETVERWIILNTRELKSRAVRDQIDYILHADINSNLFYITSEEMDEEAENAAVRNGFTLPGDVRVAEIVYPFELSDEEEETEDGIRFYKKGYSDSAIIHIETTDGDKISYVIEPFLSEVTVKNGLLVFDK